MRCMGRLLPVRAGCRFNAGCAIGIDDARVPTSAMVTDFTLQACLQGVIAGMAGSLSGLVTAAFRAVPCLPRGRLLACSWVASFVHPSRPTQGPRLSIPERGLFH